MTIVSDNPETLDGLQHYFRRAGVGAQGTRQLATSTTLSPTAAAVVVFPDDYEHAAVVSSLRRLQRSRPGLLAILVTADPKRFEPLDSRPDATPPLVIPKPAWGWTILDAIRAHIGT